MVDVGVDVDVNLEMETVRDNVEMEVLGDGVGDVDVQGVDGEVDGDDEDVDALEQLVGFLKRDTCVGTACIALQTILIYVNNIIKVCGFFCVDFLASRE